MTTLAGGSAGTSYNRISNAKIGDPTTFLVEDARFHNMRCTVPGFLVTRK
jgi:hypothetical protein